MLTRAERQATFQTCLFNWTGSSADDMAIEATGESVDAYFEANGWPKRIVTKDRVKVAEYPTRLVCEVEGEAFVFTTVGLG